MNFNTFFLDKLTSGNDSIIPNSGKSSLSSFLFSDIMKVHEKEIETNLKSQLDVVNPIENTMPNLPLTLNAIECSDEKLKVLSDFIKSFIANSNEPINITELKHDFSPVEISKKQFLLSSGGMETLMKGLVEIVGLNFSTDSKSAVTLNMESATVATKLESDTKGTEINEKEVTPLQKKTDETVKPDSAPLNGVPILQPIYDFLYANKSLSLSFKSNFEKVSVNIYELPEDNFETKINIEKFASDIIKVEKNINNKMFEHLDEINSEKPNNSVLTGALENKSSNPIGLDSLQNDNIYKTEIIEIAYAPKAMRNDLSTDDISKTQKLLVDPKVLSEFSFNDAELSNIKFRLNNTLAMNLNAETSHAENKFESTSSVKPAPLSSNSIINDLMTANNQNLTAIADSIEKPGAVKSTNALLNELNGKLVGTEFDSSLGKKDFTKIVKDDTSAYPLSNDAAKENKLLVNKTLNEIIEEIDFVNYKSSDNFKGRTQGGELIAGDIETADVKNLISMITGKLSSAEFKKAVVQDDHIKVVRENDSAKTILNESSKEKEITVKGAENKSSDSKDFAKQNSEEGFKNILQSAEQIKGNDYDKFKIAAELKTSHDVQKFIKTNEIIPEFSKIIQAGEKQSMTFQLTPENLGKVKLIVELINNQIHTRIEVESEQIKQFIQSNIEQLKQNLQSSGIQLNAVNISLTESDQKFSKSFSQRKKFGERENKIKVNDEQTRPTHKSLGYNTYEFLA